MTKLSINEPVMGRADVLLRFLQLIGKDRPQDLDSYLTLLNDDTESRTIADQVVDLIIAGDKQLYEKYEQARKDVGSRNPYASPKESSEGINHEQALGEFVSAWITLEKILSALSQNSISLNQSSSIVLTTQILKQSSWIPENSRQEIGYIRNLRNQVIHGIKYPGDSQLLDAASNIKRIITDLHTHAPDNLKDIFDDAVKPVHSASNRK